MATPTSRLATVPIACAGNQMSTNQTDQPLRGSGPDGPPKAGEATCCSNTGTYACTCNTFQLPEAKQLETPSQGDIDEYVRRILARHGRVSEASPPEVTTAIEVRQGSWPFEKIEAWASDAESLIQVALKKTKLPSSPDLRLIEETVQQIVKEAVCQ
jgi:hypothetical protein